MNSRASWAAEPSTRRRSEWARTHEKTDLREKNKRYAAIYEDEGVAYIPAEDETAMRNREMMATRYRTNRIAEVQRNIRRCRNVELCFLVDATGSMQPHINEVRKQIHFIVSKLTDTSHHVSFSPQAATAQEMKLAFVAYRDHKDRNQFEIFNFSKSTDQFKEFVEKIVADGGDDGPEDVFGGLEHAINLNWSDDAGCKVIFHICDAPCHGNTFHSDTYDNYGAGDPKGRTHTALFSKLRSSGIQYHFGKINNSTDIMLKKFAEAYGEPIVDFEIKDVDKIRESVITAVSVSVCATIAAANSLSSRKTPRSYTFETNEPDWSRCPVKKGKFLSYDFPESIQAIIEDIPLDKRQPKSAEVKIAPNPFAKGAERVAFYGMDVSNYVDNEFDRATNMRQNRERIVLKECIYEGKEMNHAKRYELSNQLQTIAAYMAKKFCGEVEKLTRMQATIVFTKIRTLCIPGVVDRYMSCEIRFDSSSKFIRFTNNVNYEILVDDAVSMGVPADFVWLVMAFSHWTYKATNGFLMIVDLEGIVRNGEKVVMLTDPAIHCKDVTRYGPMNHGVKGMLNFFSKHRCNHYCRSLGLERFKPNSEG